MATIEPVKLNPEILSMYIANCKCCLLAEAMKGCATCPFNVGLEERAKMLSANKAQIS